MAKAEVSYSPETREIKVVVPRGTKSHDLAKIIQACLGPGIVRRPCNTCTSGDHWLIAEELADVTQVNIDKQTLEK
jgi:hypothetical protein